MANLCIKTPNSASLVLIFQLLVLRPRPSVHANLVALTNEEEPRGGREALRTIVEEGGQFARGKHSGGTVLFENSQSLCGESESNIS